MHDAGLSNSLLSRVPAVGHGLTLRGEAGTFCFHASIVTLNSGTWCRSHWRQKASRRPADTGLPWCCNITISHGSSFASREVQCRMRTALWEPLGMTRGAPVWMLMASHD